MSLRLSHTTWDALDPHAIAEFWRALLGWEVDEPHLYRPGSDECSLVGPDGQVVLFFRVPDATRVKNRAHMDLRAALTKARQLLTPSGEIAVVGLSANKTALDWIWAGLSLPAVRVASRLHRETPDVGLVMTDPHESLAEIRAVADDVIPAATVRRALYYRYLLRWRRTVG